MRRKALKQKTIWNPVLFRIRNPVIGIRNPQCGIQNPRLSWIPLHGANCVIVRSSCARDTTWSKRNFHGYKLDNCSGGWQLFEKRATKSNCNGTLWAEFSLLHGFTTRLKSRANVFVNAKSHAREKPELAGYVMDVTQFQTGKDCLWIILCFRSSWIVFR